MSDYVAEVVRLRVGKKPAMLFLWNGKNQSLCSATVTEMLQSSEKPTSTYYKAITGAADQIKAKSVVSQQLFRTLNFVSLLYILLPKQFLAHITFTAIYCASYSYTAQQCHGIFYSGVSRGADSISKKCGSTF